METIALSKDQIVFNSENYKVFTGGMTIRQYLISGLTIDYSINNINM